ncbi:MAG: hypothetical protein WCK02_17530 [Bacteroidota bacterium]
MGLKFIRNTILFFILFCFLKGKAQDSEQFDFFSHTLKFSENYSSFYNDIFSQLAQSASKNKFSPYFQYNLSLKYQLQLKEKNKYRLTVNLESINVIGDTKINRFDLSKYIMPQKIESILYILGDNSQIYNKIPLKIDVSQDNSKFILDTIIQLKKTPSNYKIKFDNFKYYIYSDGYQRFNGFFKIIDEYNKSKAKIERANKIIKDIDLKDIDMIQVYDIKLDEIETYFNSLEQLNIPDKLKLNVSDPEDFINNTQQLRIKIAFFRKNINELLANLDKYYCEDAMAFSRLNDFEKAIEYYNKAISLNILNVKSQIELTYIEIKLGKTELSAKRLIDFFNIYKPKGFEGQKTMQALYQLHDLYLNKGVDFTKQKMYNEAISELEKCYQLCNNISVLPCSEALFGAMQSAKMGLYNSYISVIEKASQQKLWNMAETYIQQARKYQESNIKYINNHSKTDELLAKVYSRYIISAENNCKSGFYETALDYYSKALSICQKHETECNDNVFKGIKKCKLGIYNQFIQTAMTALNDSLISKAEDCISKAKVYQTQNAEIASYRTADSLLGKLKDVFYQQYIAFGKKKLSENKLPEAFFSFVKAKDIEDNYLVASSQELPALLQNTTKQFIFSKKSDLEFLIWANKFDSAYKIIDDYNYYISKSNLLNDTLLNSYVSTTKEKIANRYCFNLSSEFDRCVSLAKTNVSALNFATAVDYYKKATSTAKLTKNCKIDTLSVYNKLIEIEPAAKYQSLISDSKFACEQSKFNYSVIKYQEAEVVYKNKDLSRLGVVHKPIAEYLAMSKNIVLIDSALQLFADRKEFEGSLQLLNSLKGNNISNRWIKSKERECGKMLAIIDYKSNPRVNSKDFTKQYASYNDLIRFKLFYKYNLLKLQLGIARL